MNIAEIKKQIEEIVRETIKLPHFKVFLFGSRINGNADERSDVDIGIEAPTELPPELVLDLKERLEKLPTLLKFDVVDFKMVGDDFRRVAKKKTEVIYER
ncbi:MAG: nucleotidyltransferase domain-containing protein [bacterium]